MRDVWPAGEKFDRLLHQQALLGSHCRLQFRFLRRILVYLICSRLDADLRHCLGVVQNRLGDWVVLADFAGWCLPLDMITASPVDPVRDACFHLISRLIRPLMWTGLLERKPEQDRNRIEQRHYRKTILFDRFIRIAFRQDGGRSTH